MSSKEILYCGYHSIVDCRYNKSVMLLQIISPLFSAPALNILVQTIVNNYLINSYCISVVSENPIDIKFESTFTYIVSNKTIEDLVSQLYIVSERGCSDYIVNMEDQRLFMDAFDIVSRSGNIRRSDRKIIFLPYPEATNISQALDLFSMKQTDFVANILTIIRNMELDTDCEIYDLVTHKFQGSDAEADEPLYLDQWNSCTEEFKFNNNPFPHDITNLNGKIVRIACFTYKPYVFLNLDPAVVPLGRDGLELRIVEEFCRWINCTIEIVNEEQGEWGEIYLNGTGIGVLGSVVEDRADMGISALYSWYEEYLHLDFSAAGIRSAVTCVTPSPRLLKSWVMPLMPFSSKMWYAIIITFVFASIGLMVAKGGSSKDVFLTIFGVMIAQSRSGADSTWRIRRVTVWVLGAGLILVSAYGGGLASTFTVPKFEASIDTVQDLVDSKMEWGATHDAWIFSLTLSDEPLAKQLVSQFKITPANELKRRSFMRNMAFSVEKLPAGYFAIGDYLTKEALLDLTIMLEDFYYELCVVMLRKSSPYTEKMSALIGRLHQSGLLYAWETQVSLKHMNYQAQQEVRLSRVRNDFTVIKPLGFQQVVGVFMMYVFGILISILLFLGEVLRAKKNK